MVLIRQIAFVWLTLIMLFSSTVSAITMHPELNFKSAETEKEIEDLTKKEGTKEVDPLVDQPLLPQVFLAENFYFHSHDFESYLPDHAQELLSSYHLSLPPPSFLI